MVLAACGRQVTGLKTTGGGSNTIEPGKMFIRFQTVGPQDYTTFQYVIVFNTTGNGQEPFPQAFLTGFLNYSFAFVVGGPTGALAQAQLLQYYLAPGTSSGIQSIPVQFASQNVQVTPNTGPGSFGEFTIKFDRLLLYGRPGLTPPPIVTPTPSATPTGATPTPSASTTPIPNVGPTTAPQTNWTINLVTVDPPGRPIDSLGLSGNIVTSVNCEVLIVSGPNDVSILPLKPSESIGRPC
ncbi:MAG: hypothetical protein NVSMB64_23660 [Candidatus Velthaea sp.]